MNKRDFSFKHSLTTLSVCSLLAFSSTAALAQTGDAPVWRTDLTGGETTTYALSDLAPGMAGKPVKLTGSNNSGYFDFTVKPDEVVTSGELTLNFTVSPSMLANVTQLNIFLNGELQQTAALSAKQIGKPQSLVFNLDSKSFRTGQNQVRVEFVGHYQTVCENASNPSLWMDIAPESELALNKAFVRLPNDLSQFPAPFISEGNSGQNTTLPIVFAQQPTDKEATAAAIVAGYTGSLSQWGKAEFPVYFGEVPAKGHFVVFATNERKPAFLSELPAFEGPRIELRDVPGGQHEKMLIISGRNDEDLVVAAKVLTSGTQMIGDNHRVRDFKDEPVQGAYQAPNWIDPQQAMTLSSLMRYPTQLTSRGAVLPAIHLNLNMAPDIYAIDGAKAELNLFYRYSKPAEGQVAQMRVLMNTALAGSDNMNSGTDRARSEVLVQAAPGPLFSAVGPRDGMSLTNDLSIEAFYGTQALEGTPENCRTVALPSHNFQIDPSSSIAFSGFYHYAQLPEIALYTKGGFPFSKYADLSQTVAVLSDASNAQYVTTLLNAIGRISSATGSVPLQVTVTSKLGNDVLKDKDVLYVGGLPANITSLNNETARNLEKAVTETLDGKSGKTGVEDPENAPLAALLSVKSPVDSSRAVVALLSDGSRGAKLLNDSLADRALLQDASGGTVFVSSQGLTSFKPSQTWWVGDLPWYQRVWVSFANRPFLLVLCALIAAVVAGWGIFAGMRRWLRGRSSL